VQHKRQNTTFEIDRRGITKFRKNSGKKKRGKNEVKRIRHAGWKIGGESKVSQRKRKKNNYINGNIIIKFSLRKFLFC